MRNKRLIAIFSVLLALTVLVLLTSIIFSVKTVNTRCVNLAAIDRQLDDTIVDSISYVKGKSIFLLNEDKAIAKIHENVPNVRVINLESKAPNRVTVHYVKLLDYYQVTVGDYHYPLTYEGRVISKNTTAQEGKINIISSKTGEMQAGDYLYNQKYRQYLTEVVSSLEQLDLGQSSAVERFRLLDVEYENDSIYLGLAASPIMIKINRASEMDKLFGKIRLGYSVFISDKFNRSPDDLGRYKMINVVSPLSATTPLCDYVG